jgi:ERCC4-type nuclease
VSTRLFLLQGLPGVGPALAHRLLGHFGAIERIVTADPAAVMEVRGVGAKKAAHLRTRGRVILSSAGRAVAATDWVTVRTAITS